MAGLRFENYDTESVHVFGTDYVCRKPSFVEQTEYEKSLIKSKSEDLGELLFNHLEKLGLPKQASSKLNINQLVEVVRRLSGDDKKK